MNSENSPANAPPDEYRISTESLVERLANTRRSIDSEHVILACDADGTLWSGDVGNDVFHALIAAQAIRADAYDALVHEAKSFGLAYSGNATEIAQSLFEANEAGKYPDERAFAMMAWVFAGMSVQDAIEFSRNALEERNLEGRLHRFLNPVFEWARKENIAIWVVSASTKWIVEIGVAKLGIPNDHVIGMMPIVENAFVMPKLSGAPVYGPNKPILLREKCPQGILLGGFGDSSYDAALLQMARIPVAVRPKPGLLARANELPNLAVIGL